MTGLRSHSEGSAGQGPMPKPSAHIHEVICAGVAANRRMSRQISYQNQSFKRFMVKR